MMITVANRTETAARVKHAFDTQRVRIDELCNSERTLHIDSKVLEKAEASEFSGESFGNGDGSASQRRRSRSRPSCCDSRWTAWVRWASRGRRFRT